MMNARRDIVGLCERRVRNAPGSSSQTHIFLPATLVHRDVEPVELLGGVRGRARGTGRPTNEVKKTVVILPVVAVEVFIGVGKRPERARVAACAVEASILDAVVWSEGMQMSTSPSRPISDGWAQMLLFGETGERPDEDKDQKTRRRRWSAVDGVGSR